MLKRAELFADRMMSVIQVLCNTILTVMTLVIILLVITRNFFGFSYSWSEELTRYLLVWMCLLGAVVLLQRDDHIKIDFISFLLPAKANAVLVLALRLVTLTFLVFLAYQGWLTALARGINRSPALGISLTWPYMAIAVSAALMVFVIVIQICRSVVTIITPTRHKGVE